MKKRVRKKDNKKKRGSLIVGLINFVKFLALMLPLVIFIVVTTWLYPAPNSGFLALGILGCFVLGLGFVNIAGMLDEMYLGHLTTAILLLIGAGFVAISSVILYVPQIYSQLNEKYITFYFVIWTFLALSAIYYGFFRGAVGLHLQEKGLSKGRIKKAKTGCRNYWWYEDLHQKTDLRWIYKVNMAYTILFLCALVLQICVGWWKAVFPFTAGLTCALLALNVPMYSLIVSTRCLARTDKRKLSELEWMTGFLLLIAAFVGVILLLAKLK